MDVKLFGGKLSCYVVGTAFVLPDESEPSKVTRASPFFSSEHPEVAKLVYLELA